MLYREHEKYEEEKEFDEDIQEMLDGIDDQDYREYVKDKIRKGIDIFFDGKCHCGYCSYCLE